MSVKLLVEYVNFLCLGLSVAFLVVVFRRRAYVEFKMLVAFMVMQALAECVALPILFFRKALHIPLGLAADVYSYSNLLIFFVESALLIGIVYGVFHHAMRPLEGLHRMGTLVFRWVASVAVVLAVALGLGPELSEPGRTMMAAWTAAASHIMQGISILILCLLLFVCFSCRPLGLTFRSRTFGVSLGLGVYAVTQLTAGAWYSVAQNYTVYSPINLLYLGGAAAGYVIWLIYFALPEPERKMVLLPTTSPYFFWNAISEALGDDPGEVAIAGVTPKTLAPAELHLLTENDRLDAARAAELMAEPSPRRRHSDRALVAAS